MLKCTYNTQYINIFNVEYFFSFYFVTLISSVYEAIE